MGFDDRPKVNMRIAESESMCIKLDLKLMEVIEQFQKEHEYEFASFELDNIFLKNIKRNHESYLKSYFKEE
jgi:hypothetical protein